MPSPTISTSPGSASRTAPPRQGPSIIFCGSTGALPAAVAGKEGAVDRERRVVRAARHQRHHRRPDAARGMLQTGMEAKRVGWRQMRCRARRDRSRPAFRLPASQIARWRARPRCAWRRRDRACARSDVRRAHARERGPFSAHRPRDRSAAMTRSWSQPAWQRTSTLPSSASRIERLGVAVVMRRAACHPAAAGLAPAEGLGDGLSGHGVPPCYRRRRACRCRSLAWASPPATIRPGPRRSR